MAGFRRRTSSAPPMVTTMTMDISANVLALMATVGAKKLMTRIASGADQRQMIAYRTDSTADFLTTVTSCLSPSSADRAIHMSISSGKSRPIIAVKSAPIVASDGIVMDADAVTATTRSPITDAGLYENSRPRNIVNTPITTAANERMVNLEKIIRVATESSRINTLSHLEIVIRSFPS
jgi:hypothetical protein